MRLYRLRTFPLAERYCRLTTAAQAKLSEAEWHHPHSHGPHAKHPGIAVASRQVGSAGNFWGEEGSGAPLHAEVQKCLDSKLENECLIQLKLQELLRNGTPGATEGFEGRPSHGFGTGSVRGSFRLVMRARPGQALRIQWQKIHYHCFRPDLEEFISAICSTKCLCSPLFSFHQTCAMSAFLRRKLQAREHARNRPIVAVAVLTQTINTLRRADCASSSR